MRLTQREQERLMITLAGDVARRRLERGIKLNHPEAIALITSEILEGAREGRKVTDLMSYGTTLLSANDVMPGVGELIDSIQLEATFPDGTKLVTVHNPIRGVDSDAKKPGEVILNDEDVILNEGRETVKVNVKNVADRPVQVGSHYHFAEVNDALQFDREKAVGFRLNIPAGTSARFEPGDAREVELVAFGGTREVHGFRDQFNRKI